MKNIQDRILARIEALATSFGVETTIKQKYANTGIVFFHRHGEVVPIGQTAYSFQDDTYKLTLTWDGREIPSQEGRYNYFDFYQPYEKPSRYWEALERELEAEQDTRREEEVKKLLPPDTEPARAALIALRDHLRAYDDTMDDDTKPGGSQAPTGDDYNELFDMVQGALHAAGIPYRDEN